MTNMQGKARKINKVLIANRGEIAVRIIRTCQEMGIKSVAIYSDADAHSLHVKMADEAYRVGESPPSSSYLNMEKIVKIAVESLCDAIHPGYGFLSENHHFAEMVEKAGMIFIGPSPSIIIEAGDKRKAKDAAIKVGVPVLPASPVLESEDEARMWADRIGYPVIIKAAGGGGGRGMRIVKNPSRLPVFFQMARNEAETYFKNPAIYLEKFIERPKHIEVQILGDRYGNIIALYERECSIQRRFQKVIEEAPSPSLSEREREKICEYARTLASELGYFNAGTFEFILDEEGNPYFMEVNTRIQVEHPVTEQITGLDIVALQLLIAEGHPLPVSQSDVKIQGHSIELRINAEDPSQDFVPSPGTIKELILPHMPAVRTDFGYTSGDTVPQHYDSLIGKIISWGPSRNEAINKAIVALYNTTVFPLPTNIPYHLFVLNHKSFRDGTYTVRFVEETLNEFKEFLSLEGEELAAAVVALSSERAAETFTVKSSDVSYQADRIHWWKRYASD